MKALEAVEERGIMSETQTENQTVGLINLFVGMVRRWGIPAENRESVYSAMVNTANSVQSGLKPPSTILDAGSIGQDGFPRILAGDVNILLGSEELLKLLDSCGDTTKAVLELARTENGGPWTPDSESPLTIKEVQGDLMRRFGLDQSEGQNLYQKILHVITHTPSRVQGEDTIAKAGSICQGKSQGRRQKGRKTTYFILPQDVPLLYGDSGLRRYLLERGSVSLEIDRLDDERLIEDAKEDHEECLDYSYVDEYRAAFRDYLEGEVRFALGLEHAGDAQDGDTRLRDILRCLSGAADLCDCGRIRDDEAFDGAQRFAAAAREASGLDGYSPMRLVQATLPLGLVTALAENPDAVSEALEFFKGGERKGSGIPDSALAAVWAYHGLMMDYSQVRAAEEASENYANLSVTGEDVRKKKQDLMVSAIYSEFFEPVDTNALIRDMRDYKQAEYCLLDDYADPGIRRLLEHVRATLEDFTNYCKKKEKR